MQLSLRIENRLLELLGMLDDERRIFFVQLVECVANFLFVAFVDRFDSDANFRFGKFNRWNDKIARLLAECVVDMGILQLDDCTKIARDQLADLGALFPINDVNVAKRLCSAGLGVDERCSGAAFQSTL